MDDSPGVALLELLRRDASATAAERIATARGEAERLRADADERLAERRATAIAARERVHAGALERACSDARTRTAREWLSARAEALDRIFTAAHEVLVTRASDERFAAAVTSLARDALAYLPPGAAVARCATSLAPAVRVALESSAPQHSTVQVVVDEAVATGVIFETTDRAVSIDATLARLLDRQRVRLAVAVARDLEDAAS